MSSSKDVTAIFVLDVLHFFLSKLTDAINTNREKSEKHSYKVAMGQMWLMERHFTTLAQIAYRHMNMQFFIG